MRIQKEASSDPLMLADIKTHNYDLNSNIENNKDEDTMVPPLSPFFSIPCSLPFVQSARDMDGVFCQFFLALPVYQTRAKNSQD